MSFGYSYTFPALRGTQAGKEYYVAMCPLKLLPKIFLFDETPLPPELRAQRTLNTSRIPEIARYIVENPNEYAFSAITASIDGEVHFEAVLINDEKLDIGHLTIPMSASFIINDGQHRRAAIEQALEERPELGEETIAVVLFIDEGLQRSQQLFADLNKHAVKPTKSIGVLYDNRDPMACLVRDLVNKVICFKNLTEKEKTTISNRSVKLFTISGIYQATCSLLKKSKNQPVHKNEEELAIRYWNELTKVIPQWEQVIKKEISSAELRAEYVHAHNILLHALGVVGHSLINTYPEIWVDELQKLRQIDWLRSNISVWEGRAMNSGKMSKARQNLVLTSNYLKYVLNLPLTSSERKAELEFQNTKNI